MYELTVEREFCAAHAIVMRGEREAIHGHNWRVTAVVAGTELDDDGLLCDFHQIEQELDRILKRFHNGNLNDTPPFDTVNPTAELVARHLGESLIKAVAESLPEPVRLASMSVTEAPGCCATWRPGE